MPVIRYRTRDLTRLLPPTSRGMRRIDKITGRSDDMLIIRGVNVFPTQIEELICRDPALAPHYELVVTREGHMDCLAVRVEMDPDTRPSDWDRHARQLQHAIKSRVGISTTVEPVEQGGVARSIGKAKRVRDLRPKA